MSEGSEDYPYRSIIDRDGWKLLGNARVAVYVGLKARSMTPRRVRR